MLDERTPRNLPERTGRHRCVQCLAEIDADEFLRNDYLCDACAEEALTKDGDDESRRRP